MIKKEEEFLRKLLSMFRVEALEHVNAIASGLVELEKAAAERQAEIIEAIYREAHTLKGAARSVNLADIVAICQSMESVFAALKRKEIIATSQMFDLLHEVIDVIHKLVPGEDGGTGSGRPEIKELIQRLETSIRISTPPSADEEEREAPVEGPPVKPVVPEKPLTIEEEPKKRESRQTFVTVPTLTETIRISTAKLDALLLQAEELLSVKLASGQRAAELKGLKASFDLWKREWVKVSREVQNIPQLSGRKAQYGIAGSPSPRLTAFFDWNNKYVKSLENKLRVLEKSAEYDHRLFRGMVDNLLDDVKKALMLPFSSLLDIFPRFVRDLSRDMEKEVEFITQGGEIEIDRRILEEMKDPLIHLVRNCIDHGIEKPDERERKKKPARGNMRLAVVPKDGSKIEIIVSDDGAGIDAAKVKSAAVRRGVISQEEAAKLSEEEAAALIYQSGVSTSPIITDISGRGLGLAIVQEKVEKLNGMVTIDTQPDVGTTFRIVVPLTLATFRGVLVRLDEHLFVLPTTNVERVVRVKKEDIKTVENRETLSFNGQTIPLSRLEDVLELPGTRDPAPLMQAVVLGSAEKRMAFLVDEVLNEQEVLVKTLGRQLSRVRNIAGATVLGSGKAVPILNVSDLMKSAVKAKGASPRAPAVQAMAKRRSVLVVEDSITARTLLKNILETAGYDVKTTVDGVDAFTALKTEDFDLVVSDVDMPRMNGFDLTEKIRSEKKLAELPVVLVTALESREDREHGINVGASAYIVKSSFDQSNLLEVIGRLT